MNIRLSEKCYRGIISEWVVWTFSKAQMIGEKKKTNTNLRTFIVHKTLQVCIYF